LDRAIARVIIQWEAEQKLGNGGPNRVTYVKLLDANSVSIAFPSGPRLYALCLCLSLSFSKMRRSISEGDGNYVFSTFVLQAKPYPNRIRQTSVWFD